MTVTALALPDFRDAGRCAETDPEAFFPEKGGSTKAAKQVCMGCEARISCLEFALEHYERYGIWGGKSERERRKILAERHKGVPACPSCNRYMTGTNLLPGGGCRTCLRNAERGAETKRLLKGLAA